MACILMLSDFMGSFIALCSCRNNVLLMTSKRVKKDNCTLIFDMNSKDTLDCMWSALFRLLYGTACTSLQCMVKVPQWNFHCAPHPFKPGKYLVCLNKPNPSSIVKSRHELDSVQRNSLGSKGHKTLHYNLLRVS